MSIYALPRNDQTYCADPATARHNSRAYVQSGAWRCPASPTGAHWWQVPPTGKGFRGDMQEAVCTCCGAKRTMLVDYGY